MSEKNLDKDRFGDYSKMVNVAYTVRNMSNKREMKKYLDEYVGYIEENEDPVYGENARATACSRILDFAHENGAKLGSWNEVLPKINYTEWSIPDAVRYLRKSYKIQNFYYALTERIEHNGKTEKRRANASEIAAKDIMKIVNAYRTNRMGGPYNGKKMGRWDRFIFKLGYDLKN